MGRFQVDHEVEGGRLLKLANSGSEAGYTAWSPAALPPCPPSTASISNSAGSAATLADVAGFYDEHLHIQLTNQEKSDLVAVLRSL